MADEHRPFPPSARKLRRARERGEVPRSPLAVGAMVILAGGATLAVTAPAWVESWRAFAARAFAGTGTLEEAGALVAEGLAWPLAACVLAAAIGGRLVTGPVFAPAAVGPDLARLDPARGLRRVFSPSELGARLAPAALVLALTLVVMDVLAETLADTLGRADVRPEEALAWVGVALGASFRRAAGLVFVAGAVAWIYRRHRFREEQRMTRRELLRERRETQGEPAVRRRRKREARALAMGPTLEEAVASATLVVRGRDATVIIDWTDRDRAPSLGFAARDAGLARLLHAAQRIPTVDDDDLATELARLPSGGVIPRPLWRRLARWIATLP